MIKSFAFSCASVIWFLLPTYPVNTPARSSTSAAIKDTLYRQLESAYATYLRSHPAGPDVPAIRRTTMPPPKHSSLDDYIDRQFWLFFDNDFPVEPARIATNGRRRITVGEYQTGVF